MLNSFLDFLTFGHWQPKNFLRDPYLALPSIMLTSIWQGVGFQMVIILAGLQAIPQTLYEAAAVDGANRWQQLYRITLPQLRNTLLFVILVTTILSFRLFDQVQVMTRGGPNDASTTVMYEAVQTAFVRLQIAKGLRNKLRSLSKPHGSGRATHCDQNVKKTRAGELSGDSGPGRIDEQARLDLFFLCKGPHRGFRRFQVKGIQAFQPVGQLRQPLLEPGLL